MLYKTAIITGAGRRGIGRAVAIALAKEGVNTVVCARNIDALEETASLCRETGAECYPLQVDLRNMDDIQKIVSYSLEKLGSIDILVNNAGVCLPDGVENLDEETWDTVMDTNLKGLFFLSQAVLAHMKERRSGYIVNINSTVALGAKPDVTAYCTSKYGVEGVSTAMYEYAKEYGIRVSSVYPGVTDTEMLRSLDMPTTPDEWMLPDDIADCVLFLVKSSPRMVVKDIVPWAVKYDKI
jgi:NAD(P)-dependent dehydrogenase (short-subunit alcohol dehydrogenase family)